MQRLVGCPSECGALFDTATALGISLRSVTLRLRAMRLSALVARDSDADRPSKTLISTEFLLLLTFTPRQGTEPPIPTPTPTPELPGIGGGGPTPDLPGIGGPPPPPPPI